MSDFETYECEQCGESFVAHDSARAATDTYCSPRCLSEGKGLN
ncbi:hypothetical protein [Halosimplex halobium]